ncbi:serine/threonine-protein kinase [Allocoleopsis sp.]|uniref:serine/threonine-protein kinase n=1 Tax=Allocoleopsis sp. TaxID=3088169 RepID=UPI002FD3DD5B
MQLPLLPGTILQNRYCLLQVLGQGGFGRTYLVEDQARFNELCVLKEYTPKHTGIYVLDKSQELFNREAKTLYQIQHPQIPQFRAFFKENERLFLMQDYIAGKTYRTLLNERHKKGQTFSEKEMVQFLFQILPVLNYIHNISPKKNEGIIHRDISPENLICRQSDQMPVLIDFGTVKHMVFSSKSPEDIPPETIVGKVGYAPEEQLLKGEVSPNSDLYALGITVIVLMTGRKPQDFFDKFLRSRGWQEDVPSVSRLFATVLNRMIDPIPSCRYQSATELLQALRSLQGLISDPPTPPTPPKDPKGSQPRPPTPPNGSGDIINNPSILRFLQELILILGKQIVSASPLEKSIVAIGAGLILLFTLVLREKPVFPELTPLSILVDIPEKLIVTLPPLQTPTNSRIVTLQGRVVKQPIRHYIEVQSGQRMNALVKEGRVLMTLYQPNQEPMTEGITRLNNVLLGPGDYTFEVYVNKNEGITESDYTIEVRLYDIN